MHQEISGDKTSPFSLGLSQGDMSYSLGMPIVRYPLGLGLLWT